MDYCKAWRDRERTISNENDNIRAQNFEILKQTLRAGEDELGKKYWFTSLNEYLKSIRKALTAKYTCYS